MKKSALLLIDFLNEFDFAQGDRLARRALPAAKAAARLRDRFRSLGLPVIYANDNRGRWRSDFRHIYARSAAADSRGRFIARILAPRESDHFVLKPKNSAFFESPLDSLLKYLRVRRLVLTGLAVESCVLFTANDAHLRDFELVIPQDCVAGQSRHAERRSLEYFTEVLQARTPASHRIRLR